MIRGIIVILGVTSSWAIVVALAYLASVALTPFLTNLIAGTG